MQKVEVEKDAITILKSGLEIEKKLLDPSFQNIKKR